MSEPDLEQRCIDVVRGFAMDGPQKANSGHPGTAMALAPLAYTLWTRIMRYDPTAPDWPNRDRFVLSAGHASILLYSMLHLTGYDLDGNEVSFEADELLSRLFQHEMDHLDGVLLLEHLDDDQRKAAKKALREQAMAHEAARPPSSAARGGLRLS